MSDQSNRPLPDDLPAPLTRARLQPRPPVRPAPQDNSLAAPNGQAPNAQAPTMTDPPLDGFDRAIRWVERLLTTIFSILFAIPRIFFRMAAAVVESFVEGLVKLFRLKPFETPLYTKSVQFSMELRGLVLSGVAVMEWYIWSRVFKNALHDSPWRHALTAVFVVTIVVVDRAMIMLPALERDDRLFMRLHQEAWPRFVASWRAGKRMEAFGAFGDTFSAWWVRTSGSRTALGRLAVILAFVMVNSITAVMSLVSSEIEMHFQEQENVRLGHLRDTAEADVHRRYENLRAQERERLSGDLAAWNAARTPAVRADLERRRRDRLAELQAEARQRRSQAHDEATRQGRRGLGPIYDGLDARAVEAETAARDYEAETTRILNRFDADTTSGREQRSHELGASLATLEAREHDEIRLTRVEDPDALAARYRLTWRLSRGFMAQYKAFQEIRQANREHLDSFIHAAEIMLGAISVMILFLNKMNPRDVNAYLSYGMRAAAGSKEDQDLLRYTQGVTDFEAYAVTDLVREARARGDQLCADVAKAIGAFDDEITRLARAKDAYGWHLAHTDIQGQLMSYEVANLRPAVEALILESARHVRNGLPAIAWPKVYEHLSDPRAEGQRGRWEIAKGELVKRGWDDPTPLRLQFEALRAEYRRLQENLLEAHADWRDVILSCGRDGQTRGHITAESHGFFRGRVAPLLLRLAHLDARFDEKGETKPAWIGGKDMRLTLQREMVDEIDFRWISRSTGWEEPALTVETADLEEVPERPVPPPTPPTPRGPQTRPESEQAPAQDGIRRIDRTDTQPSPARPDLRLLPGGLASTTTPKA